jgi:hypothetical protein
VSLRCTWRWCWYLVEVVLLRGGLTTRVALRSYLTQPQLAQHLVDLPGEFARQIRTGVLVRHGGDVDQQSGVSPPQFGLGGGEQAEQRIPDNLGDRKRAQPPHMLAGACESAAHASPAPLPGPAVPTTGSLLFRGGMVLIWSACHAAPVS